MSKSPNGGGSTAEAAPVSLADFAEANQRGTSCVVCNAPDEVRRELEQGKGSVSYRTMGIWLDRAHGIPGATRGKLERHWQDSHGSLVAE